MIKIIIESGPSAGQTFDLTDRASIGRLRENDITLQDESVSRKHARLLVQAGRVLLRDLGSANGTFVNGQKIESVVVGANDHIRIGSIEVKVVQDTPPPPVGLDPPQPEAVPDQEKFDVRKRGKILQYSPHLRGPREKGIMTTDLDQRSGLFKLAIAAILIAFMVIVFLFSSKMVDWLMPGNQPTLLEEDLEAPQEP